MPLELKTNLKMGQKMSQGLSLTMELKQAIKLLSLPHQDLKEEMQNELLKNPLLEMEEEDQPDGHLSERDRFAEEKGSFGDSALRSQSFQREPGEAALSQAAGRMSVESLGWEKRESGESFENFIQQPVTFKSHLLWQAQISPISDQEKFILALLISHLDERGYLGASLEDLSKKEHIPLERMEKGLSFLLSLDPPGSGARSIEECLLAQARLREERPRGLFGVIKGHLKNLQRRNYQIIARSLEISMKDVKACSRAIQTMEPAPARNFSAQPTVYIAPDIYIYKEEGEYKTSLNEDGFPRLRLSSSYAEALRLSPRCPREVKRYIKEKSYEGQGFLRAIEQRKETILKVAKSLIKFQRGFFDNGFLSLKPLILEDVARDINMHPSTVSRVTANKYAQTPHGLIHLKNFFSCGISNEMGEGVPLKVVKACIRKWIKEEDGNLPLSDSALAGRLYEKFLASVSRRTVGQYRHSMGIPPCSIRKKIARRKMPV